MPRLCFIDPAAFQRQILTLLARDCGFNEIASAATVKELSEPPRPEDVVFVDAAAFDMVKDHPRVVVTAIAAQDAVLAEKVKQGAAAFLTKPFTLPGLLTALRDLVAAGLLEESAIRLQARPAE